MNSQDRSQGAFSGFAIAFHIAHIVHMDDSGGQQARSHAVEPDGLIEITSLYEKSPGCNERAEDEETHRLAESKRGQGPRSCAIKVSTEQSYQAKNINHWPACEGYNESYNAPER